MSTTSTSNPQRWFNGDAQVPQVNHLCGFDVDVVDIDVALALGLHGEFVEDLLGCLVDIEDHDLIDDVGGGLGVEVLVANRLGHADGLTVEVVANLSLLALSVVVVLTIIKVEEALSP